MLDRDILEQVKTLLAGLKSHYVLRAVLSPGHEKAGELDGFLTDFCSCSPMLELQTEAADGGRLEFAIVKDGAPTGITFPAATSLPRCCWRCSTPTGQARTCPTGLWRRAYGP